MAGQPDGKTADVSPHYLGSTETVSQTDHDSDIDDLFGVGATGSSLDKCQASPDDILDTIEDITFE